MDLSALNLISIWGHWMHLIFILKSFCIFRKTWTDELLLIVLDSWRSIIRPVGLYMIRPEPDEIAFANRLCA